MPNLSDSSSDDNIGTRDDVVQLFASDSDVDVSIHNKDFYNERPQSRSVASPNHATSSQSGGPGKGKGNKKREGYRKQRRTTKKGKMKKKVSKVKTTQ